MAIELILLTTVFLFLLYYSGVGLTRIIIPDKFKDYELLVIPFLGLFAVLFFAHVFSFIGIGSRTFTWLILAIITPLNIFAVKRNGIPRVNLFETLPVVVVAGIVFLVGMLPLFYEGYLTVVGLNGDAAYYTMLADHFLTNGMTLPKDKGTWYTNIIHTLLTDKASRVGPMYFQSMIGAISGLEGYKTFTVIINLFNSIMLLSIYVFLRATCLMSRKGSLFTVTLIGINSLFYWGAINDYLAQVMMRSILPLAIAALFHMLANKSYKGLIFSSLMCSVILMTSMESIVLVLGPLFFLAVTKILRKELLPIEMVKTTILWGLLLIVVNILPISTTFNWFYSFLRSALYGLGNSAFKYEFLQAAGGDVGYFIPLTELFGFTPHLNDPLGNLFREFINDPSYMPLSYLIHFYGAYAMAFVALLLIGYVILRGKEIPKTILISLFAPYFLMALYFRFTYPYGYFKVTSSTLFITATLITAGIWLVFSSRLPIRVKAATTIFVASIVSLSLISTYILLDTVINDDLTEWITVNRDLIALKNVKEEIGKGDIVFLEMNLGTGNKYLWIAYLLQDRETFTEKAHMPGIEPLKGRQLKYSHIIFPGYRLIRNDNGEIEKVSAKLDSKYQSYLQEGWSPLVTTPRYILLNKNPI